MHLHAFDDASKRAYGACMYVVTKCGHGVVSSLACAKSRVAPVNEIALPRLELCADLDSIRNCNHVKSSVGQTQLLH